MAINTIVINNGTGQQVLDQLNAIFPAIASAQYGSTDPVSYAVAGMWWVDTGNNLVKQRNSANTAWITQGTINAATGIITFVNATNAVNATDGVPVGMVIFDTYLHTGYVKANGATVNRADYPNLAALATAQSLWTSDTASNYGLYGTGDGSTTMVLPNWIGRVPLGANTGGGTVAAGLPNITGQFRDILDSTNTSIFIDVATTGAFEKAGTLRNRPDSFGKTVQENAYLDSIDFNASRSNAIYGASTTVQPPAINVISQIKY